MMETRLPIIVYTAKTAWKKLFLIIRTAVFADGVSDTVEDQGQKIIHLIEFPYLFGSDQKHYHRFAALGLILC